MKELICPNCGKEPEETDFNYSSEYEVSKKVSIFKVKCPECKELFLAKIPSSKQLPFYKAVKTSLLTELSSVDAQIISILKEELKEASEGEDWKDK